jgi:uncharacterized membrane protein (UPF0127 family)
VIVGRIDDPRDGRVLVPQVLRTSTAWERMRGLLARGPLESGQGLLIDPCGSVHTLFMGYALDVVFLGSDWVVRKVSARVAPWRMAACSGAVRTLELGGDEASRAGIAPGMRLRFMARPS